MFTEKEYNVILEIELQACTSKEVAIELAKEFILDNIDNLTFTVKEVTT